MLPALARFVEALRREGLPVSPAETIDAARAAEVVGVEERERFRAALRATLAKTRASRQRFDAVFDRHFAPPPRAPRDRKGRRDGVETGVPGRRRSGTGGPRLEPPPERERRERKGKEARDDGPRGAAREGRLRKVLAAERIPAGRTATPHARADVLRKELRAAMSEDEERALAAEVPRILETIRRRTARRHRRTSSGRVWARRVFRENVSHGGIPFVLPRRRRRERPSRVVLLVDVSWSVARAAGYFLWLAASVLETNRRVTVIAFVDRPVDATAALRSWMRRRVAEAPVAAPPPAPRPRRRRPGSGIVRSGRSFADWLEGLRGLDLDAASDYGRALHGLLRSHLRPAGRDTVLVVLGDARSNRFEPLPWTLDEIGRRCRSVLWLVPEPRARWGTGDSAVGAYLPHVDVAVEAADLAGLARGVAELVRSV